MVVSNFFTVLNPLNAGDDYEIQPSRIIIVPESSSGSRFCITVNTISDTEFEGDEQFLLHFANLPSEFATVGDTESVMVTIEDTGNPS